MWDSLDPRHTDSRERDPFDTPHPERQHPDDVFAEPLALPRGSDRERVYGDRDREYQLRASEVRTLATIGAFRVVPLRDLQDDSDRQPNTTSNDVERLRSAGLIRVVGPESDRHGSPLLALTTDGRDLLDLHRVDQRDGQQVFYAGIVRPRELAHDAQLYRAYRRAGARLAADGARIERVLLEQELKREYQRFLQARNRGRSDSDGRPDRTPAEIEEWAREHQLPMDAGSVQFPDLRIEYERPDGRRDIEDIEVTTPHYRGAHAAGKARAGFTRYRSRGGRLGGSSGRGGGRSSDVTLADEVLE